MNDDFGKFNLNGQRRKQNIGLGSKSSKVKFYKLTSYKKKNKYFKKTKNISQKKKKQVNDSHGLRLIASANSTKRQIYGKKLQLVKQNQ